MDLHGPAVLAALRVRAGRDRAEDLFQAFWAKLMEPGRLDGKDPAGSLRSYLVAAALNLCRDHWAAEALRRTPGPNEAPEPPDPGPAPDGPLEEQEIRDAVRGALEALSPRDRLILTLGEVEGLPHTRIAEALGVAPASVSTLLDRARKRLAVRLKENP